MDRDSLAIKRRRERNRLSQRKHRENTKSDLNRSQPLECYGISNGRPSFDNYYPPTPTNSYDYMASANQCQNNPILPISFGPSSMASKADVLSGEACFPNEPILAQTLENRDFGCEPSKLPLDHPLQFGPSTCGRDSDPSAKPRKQLHLKAPCDSCYTYTNELLMAEQQHVNLFTLPANTPTRPVQRSDRKVMPDSGAGSRSWTMPLHIAISRGHISAARLLLERGADPNAVDGTGSTALHAAVRGGHHTIVHELLRYSANTSIVDAAGWLPLHYAAETGDELGLGILLQAGGE